MVKPIYFRGIKIAFFAVIALLCVVLFFFGANELRPKNSFIQSAQAIADLKRATGELRILLQDTSSGSDQIARKYIFYLDRMEQSCQHVAVATNGPDFASLTSAEIGSMKQSLALCNDLVMLVAASKKQYDTLQPLLTADASPPRYQTLPPFKNQMKQHHTKVVESALKQLSPASSDKTAFPSTAASELKQLRTSVKNSPGLSYLPNLEAFQLKMAGERQHYWSAYADIDSLEHSLTTQLSRYCSANEVKKRLSYQCH